LLWVTVAPVNLNDRATDGVVTPTLEPLILPAIDGEPSSIGRHSDTAVSRQINREYDVISEPVSQPLPSSHENVSLENARNQMIDRASAQIQNNRPRASIDPLKDYLDTAYDDVYVMALLGRAYKEDGQLAESIYAYQESLRFATDGTNTTIIRNQINLLISLHIQRSRENNALHESVGLLQYLVQAQPYTPGYLIRLAHVFVEMNRPEDALQALYYIQYDNEVGRQAQQMAAEILAAD